MTRLIIIIAILTLKASEISAWSEHPILARIALEDMPYWQKVDSVEAKSLFTFLVETQSTLVTFLENHEKCARKNVEAYKYRPDKLAFRFSNNTEDIVNRFCHAIRINPNSCLALYLYLNPGERPYNNQLADPSAISMLTVFSNLHQPEYMWLNEGDRVHPLDVLTTANDEPDYGMDVGLFEDNDTAFGNIYGFGKQPFGNPNVFYTSQVPFHMGFYHETDLAYLLAPFLKQSFLEYRVNLFKELSVFAFQNNQLYWGWRFLGWSMHYAGDASMPYHSKPLPEKSLWQLIWLGVKNVLGFNKSVYDAIQLVSNKHILVEEYQAQEIRKVYQNRDFHHPFFRALKDSHERYEFTDSFIRNISSKKTLEKSCHLDIVLRKSMPAHLTSDPGIELSTLNHNRPLSLLVIEESGMESLHELNQAIAFHLQWFGITIKSLLRSVRKDAYDIELPPGQQFIRDKTSSPVFTLVKNE